MSEEHFSDQQVEQFLVAYLKHYPDALERMHAVMSDPFADNDELIAKNLRQMNEIAQTLDFYRAEQQNNERALFFLQKALLRKVASMLRQVR